MDFSSDFYCAGCQTVMGMQVFGITEEIVREIRSRRQTVMARPGRSSDEGRVENARNEGIEVAATEVSERFSVLRVLRPTDPEMTASLRRFGQLSPLVVYRAQDGALEVVDGFRRLRVSRSHGHPERLRVRTIEADERTALGALFTLHRGASGLSELEEAWIVRALVREHEMTQAQVAMLLRRHASWVSRRLLLVDALAPEVQTDVRLGLVSPTTAREVARLPRGTQQLVARLIAKQGMTTRQAAQLCAATEQLQATTTEEIARLCQSAQAAAPSRTTPKSDLDWYRLDLVTLERLAGRLRARLIERPPQSLPASERQEVQGWLLSAQPIIRLLADTVARVVDAR